MSSNSLTINDIQNMLEKLQIRITKLHISLRDTMKIICGEVMVEVIQYMKKYNACIIIQKNWRGHITRKKLSELNDSMDKDTLNCLLNNYIQHYNNITLINKQLIENNKKYNNNKTKLCRYENFCSEISENICKFAIYKKYKIMPCWNTSKGDLVLLNKQIEVKGFTSSGPSSFGPSEKWSYIYFVDACDVLNKKFKVYELKLSNNSFIWRNIKLNSTQTYGDIADANQRGKLRGAFYSVFYPQLKQYCNIIFDGHFDDLFIQ